MLETIREKLKNLKGLIVADPAKMLNHRNMCSHYKIMSDVHADTCDPQVLR